MQILITGIPKAGKTFAADAMAVEMAAPVRHTDDLIGQLDWSAASAEVSTWLSEPGDWIVEGVSLPRALRKWLAANPTGKPCDRIVFMATPRVELIPGQASMAKGIWKVWNEIVPELTARCVEIEYQS